MRVHPIRQIMRERGITMRALAVLTGYHWVSLCRSINGLLPACRRMRRACAMALNLPESELWLSETQPEEVKA